MPLIETTGSASAKALGLNSASGPANYIEDVFSTYLYSGNNSSQTITNGIDLSTKGGLVWLKSRSNIEVHQLWDTARGASKNISSNSTSQQFNQTPNGVNAFNTNGFSVNSAGTSWNQSGQNYVSWTFRKQPKFFDVVTYTGNGVAGRQISHSLGSTPGFMIVKNLTQAYGWMIYHRSLGGTQFMELQTTAAASAWNGVWYDTNPTSTAFTVGSSVYVNNNGDQYVAYLFAHDAGGFGTSGTDNVISCGSFTSNSSSDVTVTLGYEPQLIIAKLASTAGGWFIVDNMRGMPVNAVDAVLQPNSSTAEDNTNYNLFTPTATGFLATSAGSSSQWGNGQTVIYIAIRRGPMKTPTSGTSVFSPTKATFSGSTVTNTGFVTDLVINKVGTNTTNNNFVFDRLRGSNNSTGQNVLPSTSSASAETATSGYLALTGTVTIQNGFLAQNTTANNMVWAFARAPGFFDEVCYTGDGTYPSARAIPHNLTVAPELIIYKCRSVGGTDWEVNLNISGLDTKRLYLNADLAGAGTSLPYGGYAAAPTATNIYVRDAGGDIVNGSGQRYVAYLFASCPGVSKVGSYSGTGATQTISCGFAARFVLIKRTDSTGNWWVWDTARGMVAGTDPRLAFNVTDAESNANWVYTNASGFQIVTTDATVNASGGSYIFLAVG